MTEVEKCNLAIENFKNIQELIRFIDQKTNFILVIIGFLITVFLELSTNFTFVNPNKYFGFKCFLSWTILISGIFFVISIIGQFYIILFRIVISRKAKVNNRKYSSLFYSEEITKYPINNFINNFKTASDKKILNSILSQIYEVATIFNIKSANYQKAIKILFLNILFILIYILSGSLFLSI